MLKGERKKKYTADDYMQLEEGAPFQLINNELIMSPSPNPFHQAIVARLSKIMLIFLESQQKEAYTAGSMDVVFDENNIFQPDFLYVSEERVGEIIKNRVEGAPDMAIEILSPSNAYYDLIQKKEVYEKYGVKEYIIFDPIAKNASLYALKDGIYYLHQKAQQNEMLHSLVIPGFSFDLSYIFK
ncbi:Uma2 family endonuclease [Mucilaginibacter gotjawali]|uniref:Uma2 family endonuclease n=1 Tax=Mucilaginibacter gotjawali TaxID=1550579 RepID=A0A839SMW9_9SPHI|nr:Uma2 family endonuclease [Mucilaginibacter gotjawali]MBB3058932.1 Uma2 family endonuclease [Mucilaginibacter gotjawali]